MRRILGIGMVVAVAAGLPAAGPVGAAGHERVVFPTGVWPTDVENVQAAVDLGGTVRLKARNGAGTPTAFNFGPPESRPGRVVRLRTDVAVLGERAGPAMTTVQGGVIPFLGVAAAHTRIEGIHFVNPLISAVIIIRSTGAEIVRNRVTAAVGEFLPFIGLSEGRGIKFLGNSDPDGAITGKVVVADNVIEDMHADLSDAIVFDAVAADIEIRGNRIDTVQSSGILLIDSAGQVVISGNTVVPGPGDPGEFSFGNGMTILGSRGASYRISGNRVVATNPGADGILLFGDIAPIEGAVVTGNHVTLDARFGALSFLDDVSRASVSGNRIDGRGATAIGLFAAGFAAAPAAAGNAVGGNQVGGFAAGLAHLFLDTHTRGTTVRGCHGTVVDLGTANRVVGCPAVAATRAGTSAEAARTRNLASLRVPGRPITG